MADLGLSSLGAAVLSTVRSRLVSRACAYPCRSIFRALAFSRTPAPISFSCALTLIHVRIPAAIEAMSSSDRMGYRGQPSYGAPSSTSTSGGGMKSFFNLLVLGFIGYVLYHIFFAAPNTA